MELNQFMFPMMGSSAGLSGISQNQTAGVGVGIQAPDSAFVNLLDLVSDLEIGESQESGFSAEFMKSLGKDVVDVASEELSKQTTDAQISGMALSLAAPNLFGEAAKSANSSAQEKAIGQIQFVKNENGIDLIQKMTSQASEIGAQSEIRLSALQAARSNQLGSDAVAQWSAAIASGDLKSVTLEDGLNSSPLKSDKALSTAELAQFSQLKSLENPSKNSSNGSMNSGEKESRDSKTVLRSESIKSSEANPVQSSFERAEPVKIDVEKAAPKVTEFDGRGPSMDAKQVLLDQANLQSLQGAIATTGTAQSARLSAGALQQRASLGEAGDDRIASKSLEFVADKIDQLKSQGGGSIRIELAPKELGSIDVKVGMRGGVLQVQIKAENMVTQQALESSKNDLMARLGSQGSAAVEVASLRIDGAQLNHLKGASASSEQFLSAHNVSDSLQGSKFGLDQNMQSHGTMGSAVLSKSNELGQGHSSAFFSSDFLGSQVGQSKMSGQGSMTSSGDFLSQRDSQDASREQKSDFRDQRRDQAREQWEQFSRKSA